MKETLLLKSTDTEVAQQGKVPVEVYIWAKDSDVGHTAIRVGDAVYGYYPTDIDGDGRYTLADLKNSPGQMHIDKMADFKIIYRGDKITAYTLDVTSQQTAKLLANLNAVAADPGYYSLAGNHCTSIAYNCLVNAGIRIIDPVVGVAGISGSNTGLNMSPTRFGNMLNSPLNSWFGPVKNSSTFIIK